VLTLRPVVRRWLIDVPSPEVPQAEVTKLIDDLRAVSGDGVTFALAVTP
jgi:hypothetical protein